MSDGHDPHRRSRLVMASLAWLIIGVGFFWFFTHWDEMQRNPNPARILNAQTGELTLKRNAAGHYVADGEINGHGVTFLVDTGASQIAIGQSVARNLKLKLGSELVLETANGRVAGYQTRLDRVRVGPLEARDIRAVVTEGIRDDTVLLGMTFLTRVEFTQRGDTLVLRPLP
ncbi:MAG TPA: TIGR02281 family clan AA aspartic protease [Burkholderiales bacterium]|nr:TIGR02281 family clan AA aspartic protease [Burkholderiales bacterium]